MNSWPTGYRALVFGASGGIGSALLAALRDDARCAEAVGLSRPDLQLTEEATIAACAGRLSGGSFALMIDATGVLRSGPSAPEKRLAAIDPAAMAAAFAVNAIGPALLLKHFTPKLPKRGRCVFATLSARVGSIGDNRAGGWYGYRASKAALNQIFKTAAIEIARTRPDAVLLALQPGTVATKLSQGFAANRVFSPAEAAARLLSVIDGATGSGMFLDHAGCMVPW